MRDYFKNNKYTKWYFKIIEEHIVEIGGEKHHIIPRSMGGGNDAANIVRLTTRAHYVCHLLLPKMVQTSPHYKSMVWARRMMIDIHKINTRWACSLREEAFQLRSASQKGKPSTFSRLDVVYKAHDTRRRNGTNPFITNNPMISNKDSKRRKIEKTSGDHHFSKTKRSFVNKLTGECKYFESPPGIDWIQQHAQKGKPRPHARIPKPRIQCVHCDRTIPAHLMNRHVRARHENNKSREV